MTREELFREYLEYHCKENGFRICPLADDGIVCTNPDHCDECEREYIEWLEKKEKESGRRRNDENQAD